MTSCFLIARLANVNHIIQYVIENENDSKGYASLRFLFDSTVQAKCSMGVTHVFTCQTKGQRSQRGCTRNSHLSQNSTCSDSAEYHMLFIGHSRAVLIVVRPFLLSLAAG